MSWIRALPFVTAGRVGFSCLAALLSALLLAAQPAPAPADLEATVDRIQRQCLRAYPADLLAEMASGAQEIPEQVDADPEAQQRFLDKEVPLDKGLFYPVSLEDMLPAFERYVSPGDRFLDLGSGDGRVVFLANFLGAHAVGIEYDKKMVKISRRARNALKDLIDRDRLEIVRGDFFESSWSGYDVVFYFDQSSFAQDRVRRKLRRELGPETVLLIGFEQAPFPGFELVTAFPDLRRSHPDVKVYRRASEPAAPDSPRR
jgi:SAM-dependent methyltransferase